MVLSECGPLTEQFYLKWMIASPSTTKLYKPKVYYE